jgi:NAD(P)-dependent dehydrogenase (short-subunit alcohol dehydrogenase family)
MTAAAAPMRGRRCVVTGATSGIGLGAALGLARLGASLVLPCRDPARGEQVATELRRLAGHDDVVVTSLDLASLASVRAGADEITQRCKTLHALVSCAGAVFFERRVTVDGFEANLAVNHLGPFLFANLLVPRLRAGAPSRIVLVSGEYHRKVTLDLDDLQSERDFRAVRSAARANLAKVLFTRELARRLAGTGVTANCLHPGAVRSRLLRHAPWYLRPAGAVVSLFFQRPERGADTAVYLASSPDVAGVTGAYFIDRRPVEPSPQACDADLARRLWEVSAHLTGLGDQSSSLIVGRNV